MKNDAKSGGRRGRSDTRRWAAIERRLSGLFESSPPHVRQNLATLAAVLADEPAALDALARITAEAADDVAQKRGQAEDVLRSAMAERDRLKPALRDRFDDRLRGNLAEKCTRWDIGPAVDALLRLGVPVRALPVEAFARAILEEGGHFTPGDRDQGDTSILARSGDRLRQFARAEEGADDEWRLALREVLLAKFRTLNRRERGIVQLALLRAWPALIAPDSSFRHEPLASDWGLNYAASLGRGGAFGRIWRVAVGAAWAAGLIVVLVLATLLILGLPFESNEGVSTSILSDALFSAGLLLLSGIAVGLVVAFLYVPTVGRRLSALLLLRQSIVPALAGAVVTALLGRAMGTMIGFRDDDKVLLPVFAAAAVVLATMLRTLHGISLRPRTDLPERADGWYIAIVSAPAILISVTMALAVHLLGRPGAGVFALLITAAMAAAAGVWNVEERNQPADAGRGARTADRTYRLSKAAAILVAVLAAATIPLAAQSKLSEAVKLTAADLSAGRVLVPVGRPFTLKTDIDSPFRVPPQRSLLVRQESGWKSEIPRHLRLTGRRMCIDCARFPEFSDWISMFLRTPGNRERERDVLSLIAAARPGQEVSWEWEPSQLHAITAGTPVRVTVAAGSRYGFSLDNAEAGYIVTGIEGTHFSNRRPATPTLSGETTTQADALMDPPLFELVPGTYRICAYVDPEDEAACLLTPDRMKKWVHVPAGLPLTLSPIGEGL